MCFRLLLTVFFISCTYQSYAQLRVILFYDSLWALNDKQEATYFRNGWLDTTYFVFVGPVMDYYGEGKLQMKGNYPRGQKSGNFTFYYPNGQKKMEGEYLANQMIGSWEYFYPNGSPQQTIAFTDDDFKILSYHDPSGTEKVKDGNGLWEGYYYYPENSDTIYVAGSVVNGFKDDWWTYYNKSGVTIYEEKYQEGDFKQGKTYTIHGKLMGKSKEPTGKELFTPYKIIHTEKFIYSPDVMKSDYPYLGFLPDEQKFYFDQDWEPCGQEKAIYYRLTNEINTKNPSGTLTDYYMDGSVYRRGKYLSGKKNGSFTYFHKNGQTESSGNFVNENKTGEWKEFYEDGSPRQIMVYRDDQSFVDKYWDEKGQLQVDQGTGYYQAYFQYINITLREEGKLLDYQREGLWKGFTAEGKLYCEEQYQQGKLINGYSWDDLGNKYTYDEKTTPAAPAEEINAFYQFVGKHLDYPVFARKNNIEGKLLMQFMIDKNGELINLQFISSPHEVLNKEAERVMRMYEHWQAGKVMGQAVKMSFILPLTFSLSGSAIPSTSIN